MSFPRSVGQIPVYYDHLPTGRPQQIRQRYESIYMDEKNEPLYPFGFGLSYSRFSYGNARVARAQVPLDGTLEVTVDVTNAGPRDGQEVVQLYVRQPVASRSRPVRALKAFEKVQIPAGETRKVRLRVPARELGYHDDAGHYHVEPGAFEVYLGGSSSASVAASFTLIKS